MNKLFTMKAFVIAFILLTYLGGFARNRADDSSSFTVKVEVNTASAIPPVIRYATPQKLTVNISASITCDNTGGPIKPNGFTIQPALPSGLTLNTDNGTISGSALSVMPLTLYTVTAADGTGGSGVSTITIEVIAAVIATSAPIIRYDSPKTYTVGEVVTLPVTNSGGAVPAGGYTINLPLPAGLTLNADNGTISGTPTAASAATIYTVTATNAIGQSNATINIKILATPTPTINVPAISYQTPKVYPPDMAITPLAPTNTGGEVKKYSPGLVKNFAGTGLANGKDGPKNTAEFNSPGQLIIDGTGNIFLTDINNYSIRKISVAGVVSTYAGGNLQGSTNGSAAGAQFRSPQGIATDKTGNIYVADNGAIRKITPAGVVTNLAGGAVTGYADGTGADARFDGAVSLAIDQNDNLYIADQNNLTIRKVTPTGVVTTIAGNRLRGHLDGQGAAATFDGPAGITIDAAGNLYIADYLTIRKVTPAGLVTTIAGNGTRKVINGPAASASFGNAKSLALTPAGDLYIVDIGNDVVNEGSDVLRMLDMNGNVSTVDLRTDGSTRTFLSQPASVTFYNDELYITGNNNYIQTISFDKYTIDKPLPTGLSFDKYTGVISGTPTVLQAPVNYTVTAYNTGGSNSTTLSIEIRELGGLPTPILTFPLTTTKTECDVDFSAAAISTNTATPLTYNSSNIAVATVTAAGVIHLVGPGKTAITVSQNASSTYKAAVPVSQELTITAKLTSTLTIFSSSLGINCTGSNVSFIATATNIQSSSYQWMVNGLNAGTDNPVFQSTTLVNGDEVSCVLTNHPTGTACFTSLTVNSNVVTANITAAPPVAPSVTITASDTKIYRGTALTFTASPLNSGTDITYQWQINGVNAGANSNTFTTINLNDGDQVNCTITTDIACTTPVTSNSLNITVLLPMQIVPPNTFTPNSDGVNDTWKIPALAYFPQCRVSIFNRNGTLLVQSIGYNKPWDGTYGGKQLPDGVYYFIIDTGDTRAKVAGSVTIIR